MQLIAAGPKIEQENQKPAREPDVRDVCCVEATCEKRVHFTRRDLTRLLAPLVVEQFLAVTVGMADTMMVSYAGEAAISGVSLVDMLNVLIINIFAALATGGAVVISQYLGARDVESAKNGAGQLFHLAALAGVGIMALALAFARPLLGLLFGQIEPDVMDAALLYLRISAASYPFIALYNAGAALFRSMGNSKISMQVSILMNAVNVAGNAICVFGLGMGVAGVALPSLVGRAMAAGLILWRASNPANLVHVKAAQCLRLHRGMALRILNIGIPSAFENSLFQLGRVLVVSIIAVFGTAQISANAVANNLDSIGCIPGQAIGLGLITVAGQCIGAQDQKAAISYTKKLVSLTYLVDGALNLAVILGMPLLLGLYNISAETYELAWLLVLIHCACGIVLWPVSFVLPNALRAANDVRFTMMVSIASMMIWRLGFSYVLGIGFGMGAVGVWIAMVIDWVCRSAFFVGRFVSGKWKTKYKA